MRNERGESLHRRPNCCARSSTNQEIRQDPSTGCYVIWSLPASNQKSPLPVRCRYEGDTDF